jgi:hypothetical protein
MEMGRNQNNISEQEIGLQHEIIQQGLHFSKGFILCITVIPLFFLSALFVLPHTFSVNYTFSAVAQMPEQKAEEKKSAHIETPDAVKAVYMSQCVVGTPNFREKIKTLIDETELNTVIVDIKDYTGKIAFQSDNPKLVDSVSDACGARDMVSFIETLHEDNIYVIGRVTVFQDPYYTTEHPEFAVKKSSNKEELWSDYKGLHFIDVSARPYWEYIVDLSREAYGIGFDEINFDYIRFPSDGNMRDIYYPWSEEKIVADPENGKAEALEEFFTYLHSELKDIGVKTSADLFGMTTTNSDDLNIGQVLERTVPYFDYVMPMVYPSHYPSGFNGWEKPATLPYEVVNYSLSRAVERIDAMKQATTTLSASIRDRLSRQQLRPWLQDFDLGATYTGAMVRKQIDATYDAGLTSWALWDAGNTYTRSGLLDE